MILHITTDSKFIYYSIDQFEKAYPKGNIYLVDVPSENYKLQFIKEADNIIVAPTASPKYKSVIEHISDYDFVVMHCLNGARVKIINSAPSDTIFAWIPWGFDLFDLDKDLNYFLPETKKLIKWAQVHYKFRKLFENIYNNLFYSNPKHIQKQKAISRISYFLNRKPNLRLIQPFNKGIQQLDYYYYTIENTLGRCINDKVDGDNILIGNSATPTNNHLEAFNRLKEFDLKDKDVIVPMSYGDKKYGNQIIDYGETLFKEQFHPLMEFMPIEDYNSIIKSCGIVVMNHIRPQAFGNILTALWLGSKVFLNKKNSIYDFFKKRGVIIFSIDDDFNVNNKETLSRLKEEEVRHNRTILWKEFCNDSAVMRVTNIIERVKSVKIATL